MHLFIQAAAPLLLIAITSEAPASTAATDPMRFFAGLTESMGTTKIIMHKATRTRSIGRGQIRPDGSLVLVQRVEDEGRAPYLRQWQIRQIAPGRFAGTMSEAEGPVSIEQMGGKYHFKFRMKGDLAVDQWLTPLPGGLAANSNIIVRKFGLEVATSTALVRKVS